MKGSGKEQSLWLAYYMQPTTANRNKLIEWYLPFVRKVAGRLASRIPSNLVDADDLTSEGTIALTRLIDRFNPEGENKFTTIAGRRVYGAMLDHLRTLDWCPRGTRKTIRQLERIRLALDDAGDDTCYSAVAAIARRQGIQITDSECSILLGGEMAWHQDYFALMDCEGMEL